MWFTKAIKLFFFNFISQTYYLLLIDKAKVFFCFIKIILPKLCVFYKAPEKTKIHSKLHPKFKYLNLREPTSLVRYNFPILDLLGVMYVFQGFTDGDGCK